jgi:hypothetical protein
MRLCRIAFLPAILLAAVSKWEGEGRWRRSELRSDTVYRVDELALCDAITLGEPADLTLADCMHRLVALDGSASNLHRSES